TYHEPAGHTAHRMAPHTLCHSRSHAPHTVSQMAAHRAAWDHDRHLHISDRRKAIPSTRSRMVGRGRPPKLLVQLPKVTRRQGRRSAIARTSLILPGETPSNPHISAASRREDEREMKELFTFWQSRGSQCEALKVGGHAPKSSVVSMPI